MSTARKSYRLAALITSVACFALAVVIGVLGVPDGTFAALASLVLGFILLAIYSTGTWPPRWRRQA
jgi:multisubunit Na+/H+ antiporter MnhB subunit